VGVAGGERVLDVACGTGNASIPAAQAGAEVVGLDITPEMFSAARRRADEAGVEVDWVEGDAEALPYEDASFDVVLSVFGCMFAPRHEVAAAEIARVLRPGGRAGIAAWTPEGSTGRFFRAVSALGPPPPEGFQPPPLWGSRDHVSSLFAGTGVDVRFEDAAVRFRFDSVEAAVDEFWHRFGPVVRLREALEPEGREGELRDVLAGQFRDHADGDGPFEYDGEYLVTLGAKRAD
jgi:SAM-dependent methyltransferase